MLLVNQISVDCVNYTLGISAVIWKCCRGGFESNEWNLLRLDTTLTSVHNLVLVPQVG